jgi:hypothetical protein
MPLRKRLMAFRYVLPVLNLAAYIVLLQISTVSAHSQNVGFDPLEPLPHKIARVLSAPTYFLALTLREWLGNYNGQFLNWCAGGLGVVLWYGIGYWIDCELGILPKPEPRKSVRLGSAVLLSILVVGVAATWVYLMAVQRQFFETLLHKHLLELSAQLVVWPLVFGVILTRIMAYNGRSTSLHSS